MGGMYKDLEKRAQYQRDYNVKRRQKYQAKKREKLNGLPMLLPSGRYPFYWEISDENKRDS